ncbi:MAG: tRNA guanosine(34) transglycosylase Tgt [Planctomycetes bacterium]|nr:tRNA guanosine(34) transglycosylase Tgt [Planctomycetota bacterium]
MIGFEIGARDGLARSGVLRTPHGSVRTPALMPVGTQGTVKGILPSTIRDLGYEMVLANTYHLHLRPGEATVASLGGLRAFMGWEGPILTDSGGYQIFSLAPTRRLDEEGVEFRSHVDGAVVRLTPEKALEIQRALGSDIAMALDECPPDPTDRPSVAAAVERTLRWAERTARARGNGEGPAVFGIVQGGVHEDLRRSCAEALAGIGFDGYAIGGVSVGESKETLRAGIEASARHLPEDKPRYLMGVGLPEDLALAVARGIDLFDCVAPTRNGRNGLAYTFGGTVRLRNATNSRDPRPIEEGCDCPACARFSRAYVRHLFRCNEMLGPILATLHNLRFFARFMEAARLAIAEGRFAAFAAGIPDRWGAVEPEDPGDPAPD